MKHTLLPLLLLLSINIFATQTSFISDEQFANIWLWQLSNTSVTQEKGISLSKNTIKKHSATEQLWTGKFINNSLYLGTGETSTIFKINPKDFSEEKIFSSTNHAIISALSADKSGILFAASPNSTLYHLDQTYKIITNTTLSNNYIWDIVPSSNNSFYILTGLDADLYEYQNYKLNKITTIENEEHLLKGIVINNTLWILGEKALYKKENNKLIAVACFDGSASGFVFTNNTFYVTHTVSIDANIAKNQPEQIFSKVTAVRLNGTAEVLYSIQGFVFTSINFFSNQLIIGSDQDGFYVVYDLITQKHRYSGLGEGKIIDILNYNNQLSFLTSHSSGIWTTDNLLSSEGMFISEVYDTGHASVWGSFFAQISTPPNTQVKFYVQTGVTKNPIYWDDWQEININEKINAPQARYIRYKAILISDGKSTPHVQSVKFPFTQINIKPSFQAVNIEQKHKTITLTWSANDPNNDELEYHIYLAENGFPKVKINQQPISGTNFSFTTEFYPSGYKNITLVASDRPSNSDDTKLTNTYHSIPIMFDSEMPMISDIKISKSKDSVAFSFTATDKYSTIKEASYIINGTKNVKILPIDGIFDAKEEHFNVTIPLKETLFLQIHIMDSANNKTFKGITVLPK